MVTIIYLLKKVIPLKAQRQEAEAPDGAGSDLAGFWEVQLPPPVVGYDLQATLCGRCQWNLPW